MRTTAEETLRNDELIIAAAIKVFSEKGYEAASMQDIADEARISRGPLYYRYKTKKELYVAALEANAKQDLNWFATMLRQKKPFYEKIRDYLYYGTRFLRGEKNGFPMDIFSEPEMQDVNEMIRMVYEWHRELGRKSVEKAIRDGELKPDVDPDMLVNLLFIAFDGLKYSRLKSGILSSSDKIEEAIEFMCNLLKTECIIE